SLEAEALRHAGRGRLVQAERFGEVCGSPVRGFGRARLQNGDDAAIGRREAVAASLHEFCDQHAAQVRRNFTCSERKVSTFMCRSSFVLRAARDYCVDMRLGVLDIGSNTVHLLVANAVPGGRPLATTKEKSTVRVMRY